MAVSGTTAMVRAASHQVPKGAIPESAMREHLSEAYLHMIASAAGLTLGAWGDDYDGVDTTLKTKVDYAPALSQPKLDVQLKCSGQRSIVRRDTIAWSLETRTVAYLGAANRGTASLFCVLVAPDSPGQWLTQNLSGLLAHSHMYFLRGADLPAPKLHQETQTVHLPKSNVLNPRTILDLMEEASRWRL
jgi:hypothetical protein